MFQYLNKDEKDLWLPRLFDLLYENMRGIAPSNLSYEQEKAQWLSAVSPALEKEPRQIILCFAQGELAGYVQYYIKDKLLMVEEIQIKQRLQRTFFFYKLCKFMLSVFPKDLQSIEAYADKRNRYSISLMSKLGMYPCETENGSPFIHFRGSAESIYALFNRSPLDIPKSKRGICK